VEQERLPLGKLDGLELLELVLPLEDDFRRDEALRTDPLEPGDFAANDVQLGGRSQEIGLGLHELFMRQANLEEGLVRNDRLAGGHEDLGEKPGHRGDGGIPRSTRPLDHHSRNCDGSLIGREGDLALLEANAFASLCRQFDRVLLLVTRMAVVVPLVPILFGVIIGCRDRSRTGGHAAESTDEHVADRLHHDQEKDDGGDDSGECEAKWRTRKLRR
jgi:hypothetical protein